MAKAKEQRLLSRKPDQESTDDNSLNTITTDIVLLTPDELDQMEEVEL
jgi:hypothetical protein